MARIENIGEMTHGAGVVRINLKRLLQRFFSTIEITRIAGFPCLSDQRIAQTVICPGVHGITLQQSLVMSDVVVRCHTLGRYRQ